MSENTSKLLDESKKSFAAGIMMGISGAVRLSCENSIFGSILFVLGLFIICGLGLYLFTGKIGYIIENRNSPNCIVIWLGNFVGCIFAAALARIINPALHDSAAAMMTKKLEQGMPQMMIAAFFCGILMFAAVENYRRSTEGTIKTVGIFLCVLTFIFAGFEHSIANMGYAVLGISEAGEVLPYIGFLLIVSVFNSVGGIFMWYLTKQKDK